MQTDATNTKDNPSPRKLLKNGLDPAEMGRKGAAARVASTTPERRAEIARTAQAAMVAKHRKQLLAQAGPSIRTLAEILNDTNTSASDKIAAAKALLDRGGLGPKSSIEIEQEINLSGTINHNVNLLPTDDLSLITRRLIAAEIEGWTMPPELEDSIRQHLPILAMKTEHGPKLIGSGTVKGNDQDAN